nr:MAG TPA: ERF superfamily protein [Caudoviricetes sp.]
MEKIEEIKNTILKKEKEGYGYKYTELSQINEYLNSIGIRYKHSMGTDEKGDYIITTPIIEGKTLEPIRGCRIPEVVLSKNNNPAQEYGAAVTYARRYSLLMAFGLATEDDDAECLSKRAEEPQKRQARPISTQKNVETKTIDNKVLGKQRFEGLSGIIGTDNKDKIKQILKEKKIINIESLGSIEEELYTEIKNEIKDIKVMLDKEKVQASKPKEVIENITENLLNAVPNKATTTTEPNKLDDRGSERYLELMKIAGKGNDELVKETLAINGVTNHKLLGSISETTYENMKKQMMESIEIIKETEQK